MGDFRRKSQFQYFFSKLIKCLHFYYWMFFILCKKYFAKVSKCSHINIKKKEWSDTWEILHDGHIGPSRLPNQPPAGGVCEAPHHNLPARKKHTGQRVDKQEHQFQNHSKNQETQGQPMNNFSVHDCFYLEASEVHFYWLHNGPLSQMADFTCICSLADVQWSWH